jgi:tetratricopeptide (TPR) repeat protein
MLGAVRHHVGRYSEAIDHHGQALDLSRRTGYRYAEVDALLGLAAAYSGLGDKQPALAHARDALALAGQLGFGLLAGRATEILREQY